MAQALTPAQRRFLQSGARRLRPSVNVGKGGASENVLRHLRALLGRRELIKVRLLEAATEHRHAAARQLADRAEAALVDLVGRVVVLYKPNQQLPPERRIQLPQRQPPPAKAAPFRRRRPAD